jgi:hypothetical protein
VGYDHRVEVELMRSTLPAPKIVTNRKPNFVAAMVVSITIFGYAQTPPQVAIVYGTVTDVTGALIPHATVSLAIADSNTLQTTTDSKGHFALDAKPGEYILKASAPGFDVFKQTVHLTAATPTVENISIKVGGTCSPCVTIEAATPIEVINPSLDLLLPLTTLPPFHLSAKGLKHLQR